MSDDVEQRLMWLAGVICSPNRHAATTAIVARTKQVAAFSGIADHQELGAIQSATSRSDMHNAGDRTVLQVAWGLLAVETGDSGAMIHPAVAIGLLCMAEGDTREARARLRVRDDAARGKYDPVAHGRDLFAIAEAHWRGEMQRIVAATPGERPMRAKAPEEQHPALNILVMKRWDDAHAALIEETRSVLGAAFDAYDLRISPPTDDRTDVRAAILEVIDNLYALGTPSAGALALAWSMLTVDPRRPTTFWSVLPQLQRALDQADLPEDTGADLRDRMNIWWRAAEGEWRGSRVSIFRIAFVETRRDRGDSDEDTKTDPRRWSPPAEDADVAPASGPTLIVMPAAKASGLNDHNKPFKELVDAALPLVVVRDVAGIRAALRGEFPHATAAVDLVLRDLRDGKPALMKPVLLVGAPGSGKSRLVRRLAEITGQFVYRYDAASSADSQFGGTGKAWSNTEASVPARAVQQSKIANPIVMVDEIEKAAERNWNGRLWDAMLPFLDRETAARYRDQSLDAELNLSMVTYVATANDVTRLPASLRDRFRIIKVPAPTLQHLPALAAQVMRDLAIEDEVRNGDMPLAGDELAVIGRAWSASKFSMRALQKIVQATLEARDDHAMRH
jgi:ATP-dependent Lon protease